jgi:serine/threonine protein phosphatase PrpC
MLFDHRAYWLPKDIQDPNAYEDAFVVDGARGVAAICDGVASTIFAGRWAGILAQAVAASPPDTTDRGLFEAWLSQVREAWTRSIDESSLAWHQKPKLVEGAGATLLWVEVSMMPGPANVARPYQVRAYSIGDCCLFHVRNGRVLQTFPIQESTRFEENPQVIRSVVKRSDVVTFEAMETQCNPGDLLILCTDAIAAWTMRQIEAGMPVDWEGLWQMPQPQWQQWVVRLRQAKQIRFDDSTAVLLRIGGVVVTPRPIPVGQKADGLLDAAETKLRGAFKSLKGSLRKGLKDLSDSKWLDDKESK